MPTINATPGEADSNSYGTLEEAETYMESRLHITNWSDASDDEKDSALIWATRLIDATVRFTGVKASVEQALEWPRTGMYDRSSNAIDDDVIPQQLKDVQFELALLLLVSDRTVESDVAAQGITDIKAGPVSLSFKESIEMNQAVPANLRVMFPHSWLMVPEPWALVV